MKNKTTKIMKRGRKLLLAICLPVLAVVLGVSAIVGALLGVDGNKRMPVGDLADSTTAVSSTTINLGSTKINTSSASVVQSLINYVAGSSSNVAYTTLSTNMESWKGSGSLASTVTKTKTADQFTTKTVTLGGIVWNVMYVSKADYTANDTTAGDIIVTLWQAASNSSYMSKYNNWYADTPTAKYPSSMYGSSLVRSTLVGSSYVSASGDTTLTSGTQNSHWKPFTTTSSSTVNGYAEVLATPANMKWQETQSPYATMKYGWRYPNDAWGNVGTNYTTTIPTTTDAWYGTSTKNYNYADNEYGSYNANSAYVAWKNDRIWLPSTVETGWGDTSYSNKNGTAGSGIWNASANQRKTDVSSGNAESSWLRSGNTNSATFVRLLDSSGKDLYHNTSLSYAVRPAIHLNLKKAAQAAGLLTQSITYHTSYGTAPANTTYTPGTSTALTNPTNVPATAQFVAWKKDGYTGSGATIANTSGQTTALNLYATFKPKAATVTSGVTNNAKTVTYGDTNVSLSATISQALIDSGDVTLSTYWRKLNTSTNIASGGGITVVNSKNPSITFAKPTTSQAGTYVLYYKLTATTAGTNKGMGSLGETEAARFTLTVNKATCTVATKPTINPSQIYVGQPIAGSQLTGGAVSCSTTGDTHVVGSWQITTTGVFTSSGKIYAKFTPEDADINPITSVEIPTNAVQLKLNLTEDVSGIFDKVLTPKPAKSINVDYYTSVSFALDDEKVIFTVKQDGVAGKTVEFPINAHEGFSSYMHLTSDATKAHLTNSSSALTYITTNRDFTIAYVGADTPYTIYYLLDGTDSDFPTATTPSELDALISGGSQYVYKSTVNGATGSQVKYLSNGKPYNATLAGKADIGERFLNEELTGELATVSSDGSTVQLIYLELNKYTVSYSASGAAPSMQTKVYKYGATITLEGINQPAKDMSTFTGWYYGEEADANAVKFGEDKVSGDAQLHARFEAKQFRVIFDLNLGTGSNQIDLDHVLAQSVTGALSAQSYKVVWDTTAMFDASFKFGVASGSGRYSVTYSIDNVKSNKSLTAAVPRAIGYTFKGWYASDTATAQTSVIRKPNTKTADDIILTARWEPTVYTVRFNSNGNGSGVKNIDITNLSVWGEYNPETEEITAAGNVLPENPTRAGYNFTGWYVSKEAADEGDDSQTIYGISSIITDDDEVLFSVADFADYYENNNFSNITLYAGWKSLEIGIRATITGSASSELTFRGKNGNAISSQNPAHINDVITVELTEVELGYIFKQIIVIGNPRRELKAGALQFTITGRDVVEDADGELYVNIEAIFDEERYTIEYDPDGGKASDTSFARTYSVSELAAGAKLPSKLKKAGWDFDGWIFTSTEDRENQQLAHDMLPSGQSYYGAELYLVQPVDEKNQLTYRDVTLKARWKPQAAPVYLYNATYNSGYTKPTENAAYYEVLSYGGDTIVTDMEIEINNPKRDSFYFLGWATSRNGVVVYPASEDESVTKIKYTAKADHDVNGNPLNQNNLYAVWHIKGVNYIIMQATNNGSTYTAPTTPVNPNAGIKMSAKPAQNYTEDDAKIKLTYYWYRINDGMYDMCFTTKDYEVDGYKIYVDADGNTTSYEKDGKYYDVDKTTELAAPVGTKLTYKDFDRSAVGTYCVEKFKVKDVATTAMPTVTITNVADSGIYVCVVDVVATESEGGTTSATGYGEIEIKMKKAVYGGLTLADKKVTYNATEQWSEITISGRTEVIDPTSGLRTITLPDGSKVNVTYRYYVGAGDLIEGETREEITDLSKIKNVGEYHVVASFEFAIGGDLGNYEPLAELEADLYIQKDVLSTLKYVFTHDGEDSELNFSGSYDGKAYGVDIRIEDTFEDTHQAVTDADDVYVTVKVYKVTENGDVELTAGELPTTEAGMYAVEIVGLDGEAADNYDLGDVDTRKQYTITKKTYEVASHILFEDKEVEYNNEIQTISISFDGEYSLPETVKAVYETKYIENEEDFTATKNTAENNNGGRYAGTYTVTVTFVDSAAGNHTELESKTATLTIKKTNFFGYYNKNGIDVLRDGGFSSSSYAYLVGEKYNPHISSGMLTGDDFDLTYDYYRINEATQDRTMLGSGTHEELVNAGRLISLAGKYEIVAHIEYVGAYYRNNFEEIEDSESTITYVIREVAVESVSVIWADGFDKKVNLGVGFDYSWIKQIDVVYAEGAGTLTIEGVDILLAGIKLEAKGEEAQTTFWHVGTFDVIVSFYGTESVAYEFTVIEEVTEVTLKYRVGDEGEYQEVPEDGLELLKGGEYSFIVEYACTDENGEAIAKKVSEVVLADIAKLGENVLLDNEEYYSFGDFTVSLYEVLEEVTWEYSLDGENWEAMTESVAYAGKAYQFRAVKDGKEFLAYTETGADVINVGNYEVKVGRSGDYRIDEVLKFAVTKKVLDFVWDTNEFEFNTFSRTPVITEDGLEEVDEGLVTFGFEYYYAVDGEDGETVKGNKIQSVDNVKLVGNYIVKVILMGDVNARNNYTLDGGENVEYLYAIVRAEIKVSEVYYSESNYGKNVTYEGNTELRLSAMKVEFGENPAIAGDFKFITNYDAETGEYEEVEGTTFASVIASQGTTTVQYVYIPKDKNYAEKIGEITITVKGQKVKTGTGALSVEFGENAIRFYVVNQTLDTHGIEVYQLYESAYQENGKWYGLRTKVDNPVFRIDGYSGSIQSYEISSLDLSSGKLVLKAMTQNGDSSGTLDIPVMDKRPTGLEISSTNHRTTYYVGETPDFSDIEFKVLFGEGTVPVDGLKIGTIKADFNSEITEPGTFTVRFSYLSAVWKDVTFTAEAKSDLTVVLPTNTVLTYKGGDTIAVPEVKFNINGTYVGQNALEGVNVTTYVYVYNTMQLTTLAQTGKYTVRYVFTVTNPKYNAHDYEDVTVTVTENPYSVEITVPDTTGTSYTKEGVTIPRPTVGAVTDSTDNNNEVPGSYVEKIYRINGTRVEYDKPEDWKRKESGEYEVEVIVNVKAYNGHEAYEAGRTTYTYEITQAANDRGNARIDIPEYVLISSTGNGFDEKLFKVTADFGAENVIWEYSTDGGNTYERVKPTEVGKYYVRAVIEETNNYAGLETDGKPFELRDAGTDAVGENGSISGGKGIGKDWTLEITQMEAESVSQVSITKQNVLDGYEVVLKNEHGVAVSNQGEYKVRIKLGEELSGSSDLRVFYKDANGNTTELSAKVVDGYIEFSTSEFGTFMITSAVAGAPMGLLIALIVLGVVAAGMITACIIVFVKKKKKGAQ